MEVPVADNLRRLLGQEDTDRDRRITIKDSGPKHFLLVGRTGESLSVEGTYALSVLLGQLAMASEPTCEIRPESLLIHPLQRTSQHIRQHCWSGLTRCLDHQRVVEMVYDEKMPGPARLYLPAGQLTAAQYYQQQSLEVVTLPAPAQITADYVRDLNSRPGMLGLAFEGSLFEQAQLGQPLPYLVPGGRFNEMYGWDSYFIGLGLLCDGLVEKARFMVEHLCYQVRHYGKILNANRSYYLTRSQPPFLTAFALAVHQRGQTSKEWLARVLSTAIEEYLTVWNSAPRLTSIGLARYRAQGIGMPPETEREHYFECLRQPARKAKMTVEQYRQAYLAGQVTDSNLEEYFEHDRTVRESGHDTSYRLEGRAKHLCPVDLNSLLYRYETDLAEALDRYFDGRLAATTSEDWRRRANQRKALVDRYCWDEQAGQYFDYDFVNRERTNYCSATGLWPLWAGLACPVQAQRVVESTLPQLELAGGLAGCSLQSRGPLVDGRTARQWDYPYGWAPHQMMAWAGLERYGFHSHSQRLRVKWLQMIAVNAARYSLVVPEKYDVERCSHDVFCEYGNVGTDFEYITKEGFGWTNASFQVGLEGLQAHSLKLLEETVWRLGVETADETP